MNTDLNEDALELGRVVQKALESAGGDQLVQRAEADPSSREGIGEVLAGLGLWELDPRGSVEELEAAAAACRATGWWAAPYPVAERLARPDNLDVDALFVVDGPRPTATTVGLDLRWGAVGLNGTRARGSASAPHTTTRWAALATELSLSKIDDDGAQDLPLALVLPCWTLLGMMDRAIAVTVEQVNVRQQFGQPLAKFQSVQFQLTEAEVERAGVEVLAKYALWSIQTGRPEAFEDALSLRLATLEAAEIVFRITHQLHGATGFCDETQLSWISRYSQPLRRHPLGVSATRKALTETLGDHGLVGLFHDVTLEEVR